LVVTVREPRNQGTDWSAVVARLITEGRVTADLPVSLFLSAAGELHGRADCATPSSPITVPLATLAATASRSCDCGGWLATKEGARVAAASTCFDSEADRDAGTVPGSWSELFSYLTRFRGGFIAALSSEDPDRIEFASRALAANLEVAERCRGLLDPAVLDRAIAAQALRLPVTAEEATGFAHWARSLRLEKLSTYEGFRDIVPYAEKSLREFLCPTEPVLVGLDIRDPWPARFGAMPFPFGLPAELALLLWHRRRLGVPRVTLHLHPAVAAGLLVLANPRGSSQWSVSVAGTLEPDPEVAELAVLLWSESPEGFPGLDAALLTARGLLAAQ
jgi:hypothetical protein